MQKAVLLIIAIIATVAVVSGTVLPTKKSGISGGVSTTAPTASASPAVISDKTVPDQSGEDTIRTFIQLLNEQKILEAIAMMDENLITSDSVKQQYGVVFNSFQSMVISSIALEEFGKDLSAGKAGERKEGEERYRVDLKIMLKSESHAGMWEEGVNTRWITVLAQENRFMIHDIATGP